MVMVRGGAKPAPPSRAGARKNDCVAVLDRTPGDVIAGPATFPKPVYESRVVDGRIELRPLLNT